MAIVLPSQLKNQWKGEWIEHEPLSRHTSWQIGGPADWLCIPDGIEDLHVLADWLSAEKQIPFVVVGLGSNLLVADQGFRGIAIKTKKLNQALDLEAGTPARICAGSSVPVRMLLSRAAREGWGGLEFLTGIPGTCGGAAVMNAGTHLGETESRLVAIETLDLHHVDRAQRIRRWSREQLEFEYRNNKSLRPSELVTRTWWSFEAADCERVDALIRETLKRRKDSQPIELPSCGSVFKNPLTSGLKSWQVIEKLGLRGTQIGGAQISPKHANFIVNLGNAKAADVVALIELIQQRAFNELGIELETEVRKIGF